MKINLEYLISVEADVLPAAKGEHTLYNLHFNIGAAIANELEKFSGDDLSGRCGSDVHVKLLTVREYPLEVDDG